MPEPRSFPLSGGAFQEEQRCSPPEGKPPGPRQAGLPQLAALSPRPARCTSRESFVCVGQALTAQMHPTGSLSKQGGGRGTAPSRPGQAGTLLLQGELAAGQPFSPCSWSGVGAKRSIPTQAPHVGHSEALTTPAWLPAPRDGTRRDPSAEGSDGRGVRQALVRACSTPAAPTKVSSREQGCSPGWETRLTSIFKARASGWVRWRGVLTLLQSVEQIFAPDNEFTDRHKKIEAS